MNKVAAIQMCSSHVIDENLLTAQQLIEEAAKKGAKLIVLPENFAIMALKPTDVLTVKESLGHQGKIQSFLAEQAQKNKIWLVGGTMPIASAHPDKVRAASLVFNDQGELVERYDKIHLFDVTISDTEKYQESAVIEPGNRLVLVDTPLGKMGMGVCYDIRFPELFRCLFNLGAEIFVLPTAFTVKTGQAHFEILTRSRAIENFSYMIAACQGGSHTNDRKTYGDSLIIGPWGNILSQRVDPTPGIIYADIDLNKLYEIRKNLPVEKHQKISFQPL